jgi:hypothetical protein
MGIECNHAVFDASPDPNAQIQNPNTCMILQ